jgi:hypothetical protein
VFSAATRADDNPSELSPVIAKIDLNSITFVLLLLLATGSAASPFNALLRSQCFGDGCRRRGLDLEVATALLKTIVLMLAFCAGVLEEAEMYLSQEPDFL